MRTICKRVAAAFLVQAMGFPLTALAAPGDGAEAPGFAGNAPTIDVPATYELGTELVVRNWVMCTRQSFAEQIARAWADGAEVAAEVYADLVSAKSCGQFPELRVILRERVYWSAPEVDRDARVFAASVNIGGGWPTAFVVYSGLSED